MSRVNRVGNVLKENEAALSGYLAHGKGFKTRFCWECQRDKPLSTGKLFGFKGQSAAGVAGHMRFACAECITARALRKAAASKSDAHRGE